MSSVLRYMKIMLVRSVAAWALLGVFGNLVDWANVTGSVRSVASMASLPPAAGRWKATEAETIVLIGAVGIPLFKSGTLFLTVLGARRIWSARRSDGASFQRSKEMALAGCAVAVACLFLGWIVVAEGWFEIWRSPQLREGAAGTAFRYGGFVALIAVMVGQRDD